MNHIKSLFIGLTIISLAGCDFGPNSGEEFSLPEGDSLQGKAAFVEIGCNNCHSIADIGQLQSDDMDLPRIKLGGSVSRVKTYGDLVTSIINPSHRVVKRYNQGIVMSEDGESIMRNYNDVMTVTQLVDLVTFLEENYEVIVYPKTSYPKYGPLH